MKKLISNLKNKKTTIGIVGLGYVGLNLGILFAKKNFKLIGFENNNNKINFLKKKKSYIERIDKKDIQIFVNQSKLTNNFKYINDCDVIIIALPTPLKNNKYPDLSFIKSALNSFFKYLRSNQLIILESTSYPGTTRDLIVNKLNTKFQVGKNIFVGFSSERIDPGMNENKITFVPKVVSGYSSKCLNLIDRLYSCVFKKTVKVDSLEKAELSKLLENVYRSVNIGFINEMKMISDKFQIDIFEVIKIASTKTFGFRPFAPGPGVGGHCIPIDPIYLYWKAKKLNYDAKFIKLSKDTNNKVLNFIITKVIKTLKKIGFSPKNSSLLILGVSYKKNLDDIRESSSIKLIEALLKKNFKKIDFSDPHISKLNTKYYSKRSTKLTNLKLKKYTITILMTDHDKFDYKKIYEKSNIIIDCRGKYKVGGKVIRA